ncbi:MAG: hypothetical protein IJF27_00630 [Oscillospiraceae bacterium]|nr:hypothetical protein [Oscillospiraceae bacterium]
MQKYISRHLTNGASYSKRMLMPTITVCLFLLLSAPLSGFIIAANGGVKTVLMQWVTVVLLFLLVTAASVILFRIGTNAHRDALVFFTDSDATLYVLDARNCAPANSGFRRSRLYFIFNFFKATVQTGNILKKIAKESISDNDIRSGWLKEHAVRIASVDKLQCLPGGRYVMCSIISPGGVVGTQKYDISNHTKELFELLEQHSISGKWETTAKTYVMQICISIFALLLLLVLCILAYPAVGILPEAIYFPCLFALSIPVFCLCLFILKRKRGE